jgi:hypothetical protein
MTYGGESRSIPVQVTAQPYAVAGVDVAGRFEFRPVLSLDAAGTRLLSVYTFGRGSTNSERVLIHQLKMLVDDSRASGGEARFGFTGRQFVYDRDARELSYWCAVRRL